MKSTLRLAGLVGASLLVTAVSAWAGPKVVSGPGANPECFKPWSAQTKFFQWDKKPGPYKIALVNGFVGNTWRIQMVKTAKAFADQPGIKENIEEFKVVSTGTDVAAQLGAMEDFINQGFDAIVTIAVAPDGFDRIIRLADKNNVVVVPFDNILDTDKVMMVNEDQKEMGRSSAKWLIDESGKKAGDILEVRGLPGNSVDRDRHVGFREVMEAPGNNFKITEVVGNWDTGTSQKVTADAFAVHGHFDGVFTQGGSDGTGAGDDGWKTSLRPDVWRRRERVPQADSRSRQGRPQGHVLRTVPGARRHRYQGSDRGTARQCHASTHLDSDPGRDLQGSQARHELLAGPQRGLLRPEPVPPVRRKFHGARDHGAEREEHSVTAALTFQSRPGISQTATS